MKPTRAKNLVAAALALGALWFLLCRQLSGEWSVNEQYSYGWFVPFFAAFLFWLRWEDRPEVGDRKSEVGSRRKMIAIGIAVVALLVLLPVRLFEVANPDWRPLSWLHTAAVVALTFVVIWFAGGKAWVRHFAFPVLFIFVAVPWISPIEEPIVQGLMRIVAAVATEVITLFGIPAQLEGNLIRVNTGLVGVSEACSGVRSLQTSLMIGLLFGELKRFSVGKRVALVLGAVALAILANFGRALFLVWIAATRSVPAVSEWHDIAGYAIVAIVFLGTLGLSAFLGKRGKPEVRGPKSEVRSPTSAVRPPTSAFLLSPLAFSLSLAWLLAVEIGVEAWYRSQERNMVSRLQWRARWPENASAFSDIPITDEVRTTLRFDEGREVAWKEPIVTAETTSRFGPDSVPNCYLFFFRWSPGTSTILRARAHRPDVCLPSIGWRQTADHGVRTYQPTDALALPFRHFSFARDTGPRPLFAHAFFCLGEDKVNPAATRGVFDPSEQSPTNWMPSDRWRVVREGLRNPGQQVMQFIVITPTQLTAEQAEGAFAKMLPRMVEAR